MFFSRNESEKKFERFKPTDTPEQRAEKIINLLENEDNHQSISGKHRKLYLSEKNYILQNEHDEWEHKHPPSYLATAFIVRVGIARERLSENPEKSCEGIEKFLSIKPL